MRERDVERGDGGVGEEREKELRVSVEGRKGRGNEDHLFGQTSDQ